MTQKQNIRALLLFALVFVSLGGFMIHLRIHPPNATTANLIPFIAGIIGILIVPAMFLANTTKAFAYVVNGMLAIIGIITMGYFSIKHLPANPSIAALLTGTLLADIFICFNVFLIASPIGSVCACRTSTRRSIFLLYRRFLLLETFFGNRRESCIDSYYGNLDGGCCISLRWG